MAIELEEASSFQKLLLQEILLETRTITPEQLRQALQELNRRRDERRARTRRLIYLTDLPNYGIVVVDSLSRDVVAQIALPRDKLKEAPVFVPTDWIPYGFGGVALFSAENKFLQEVNWSVNEQSGLGIGADDCILINARLAQRPFEAHSQHLTHEIIPLKDALALPLDLTLNRARDRLFVSDRGAGIVHIIDTAAHFVSGTVVARKEGGKKSIHIAEHPENRTLFVTDNTTPALTVVDPRTLKGRRQPLPYGPLGNLAVSPDGQWLFVTVLKQDEPMELLILDTTKFRAKKLLPLTGFPFSLMDDPKDPMLLAPDGLTLLVVTYVNEPSLFTPVVNVIGTEEGILLDKITLLKANKPTSLAWKADRPEWIEDDDRELAEVLIDLGYTTQDGIEAAIAAAEAPEEVEEVVEEEEEEEAAYIEEEEEDSDEFYPVLNQYDLDPATLAMFSEKAIRRFEFLPVNRIDGIFSVAFVRANHEEALRIIEGRADGMPIDEIDMSREEFDHFMKFRYHFILEHFLSAARPEQFIPPNLNPPVPEEISELGVEERVEFMELDAEEVEELLVKYFVAEFYQNEGIDLRLYEDARLRLLTAAAKARMELANKTETRVYLQYIYVDEDQGITKDLDLALTRDQLTEMCRELIEQAGMPAPGEEVKVVEDFTICPSCRYPMPLGIVACPNCSYEIVKMTPKEERKLYLGTPPLNANLAAGELLVTDTERNRVMVIDRQYQIQWFFGPETPLDVENSVLKKPSWAVAVPGDRTLVCDTGNNRVIEVVNKDKRLAREIGNDPNLPQLLITGPAFATRLDNNNTLIVDTLQHRIIEISMLDQLVWQFGTIMQAGCSTELLNNPRYIQRLASGNNLITDTGNHRVIEIDPSGKIVWQYGNRNHIFGAGAGKGPDQLNTPTMANRMTTDFTLICDSGNNRVIQVNPIGQIVWEYPPEGTFAQVAVRQPIAAYQADEEVVLIFGRNEAAAVNRALDVIWSCTYDNLFVVEEQKTESVLVIKSSGQESNLSELEERERRLAELAAKAAKRFKREASTELLPIQLVMVDRTHHQVCIINRNRQIEWQFGATERDTPESLERPQMARWLPGINRVLIADTERHRVIMVDRDSKRITWQYGITDAMGSGPNQIGQPRSAEFLPSQNLLITDSHSNRVIEVTPEKKIVWQYGGWEGGISPLGDPYYAVGLEHDHRLIVDWRNHVVLEVNPAGEVVWQFGTSRQPGSGPNQLSYPEFAQRLKDGNTLICDTRNNRVIEVTPSGKIIWEFKSGSMGDGDSGKRITNPNTAYRLDNNNTLIVHSGNRQALEVDIEMKPVWSYSLIMLRR